MKTCTKCGLKQDNSCFGFYKDNYNGKVFYYPKGSCRACERKYQRERNARLNALKPPKPIPPLITEKLCTRCNKVLGVDKFGRNNDKRCGIIKVKISTYCLGCNNKRTKEAYKDKKNDSVFKEENRKRAKEYHYKHRDLCNEKNRNRGKTEIAKEKRRISWHKKKGIYKERNKKAYQRYYLKAINELTDHYIIVQLEKEGIDRELTKQHPELIEAKRLSLLIKRKIKNHVNTN